jgi:uncharacterized membrane protein YkvA (DUF1232 family)
MRRRRRGAAAALWLALRGALHRGGPGPRRQFGAVPRMLRASLTGRYRGVAASRLTLMAAALLYILSPIDLVPEGLLAFVGLADDAVVAAWLVGVLLGESEAFLVWERSAAEAAATAPTAPRPRTVRGEVVRGEVVPPSR